MTRVGVLKSHAECADKSEKLPFYFLATNSPHNKEVEDALIYRKREVDVKAL